MGGGSVTAEAPRGHTETLSFPLSHLSHLSHLQTTLAYLDTAFQRLGSPELVRVLPLYCRCTAAVLPLSYDEK